jgi:hypothetical protein
MDKGYNGVNAGNGVDSMEGASPTFAGGRHGFPFPGVPGDPGDPGDPGVPGVNTGPLSGPGLAEHHAMSRSLSEGPLGPPPKLEDPQTL